MTVPRYYTYKWNGAWVVWDTIDDRRHYFHTWADAIFWVSH